MNIKEYEEKFTNKDFVILFKELKNKIEEEGLLKKIPIRGMFEIIIVLSLFLTTIYSYFNFNYIISIVLSILTMVRSTYVAHDLIHQQYFESKKINKFFSFIFGNVIIGLSRNWWERDHNVNHHTWTNSEEADADIKALDGMFTKNKGKLSFIHNHRRIVFTLALFTIWFSFHFQSWYFILKEKFKIIDLISIMFHYFIPIMIFLNYSILESIISVFLIYTIYSFFASLVFITNHIGMEVIEGENYKKMPWFELQTRTSRNVSGGFLIHWLYGGLNTQIEHHLFPKAPRLSLLKVQKITEEFCLKNNLFYHKTTLVKSYVEIYNTLKTSQNMTFLK